MKKRKSKNNKNDLYKKHIFKDYKKYSNLLENSEVVQELMLQSQLDILLYGTFDRIKLNKAIANELEKILHDEQFTKNFNEILKNK